MLNPNKKEKALFLYNPSSGKGRVLKHLPLIESELKKKHGQVDIVKSLSPEFFSETIKKACEEYDYIYFSGGDGTFNMVINAVPFDRDKLPIFGFLPGGSTNDMSYNLNISKKIKKGIIDLVNSKPKEYNVGLIGDKRFIYVADFGMFTNISHITPQRDKKRFGRLAYGYYGVKSVFNSVKSYRIVVDGVIYNSPLMIISNSREVGSFKINPLK